MRCIDLIAAAINNNVPFSEWDDAPKHVLLAALSPALDPVPEKGEFPEDMRKAFNLMRRLVSLSGPSRIPEGFTGIAPEVVARRNDPEVIEVRRDLIKMIQAPWTFVF